MSRLHSTSVKTREKGREYERMSEGISEGYKRVEAADKGLKSMREE